MAVAGCLAARLAGWLTGSRGCGCCAGCNGSAETAASTRQASQARLVGSRARPSEAGWLMMATLADHVDILERLERRLKVDWSICASQGQKPKPEALGFSLHANIICEPYIYQLRRSRWIA